MFLFDSKNPPLIQDWTDYILMFLRYEIRRDIIRFLKTQTFQICSLCFFFSYVIFNFQTQYESFKYDYIVVVSLKDKRMIWFEEWDKKLTWKKYKKIARENIQIIVHWVK